MNKAPAAYIDTGLFIAILKGEKGRADVARSALEDGRTGVTRTITSALTIAEVVRGPDGVLTPDVEESIKKFFLASWLHVMSVDRIIAASARQIVRDHGVKPPDAIHLATALDRDARTFFTFDDGLLELKNTGLDICKPKGQMVLAVGAGQKHLKK